MNLLVHIFVWYFLVTSWWSVYRLTYCSLYYNGLGFFGVFLGFVSLLGGGDEAMMLELGY